MPSLIVLGHARSGTTALLNYINNHRSCAITGELNLHYLASLKSELEISETIDTWREKKRLELSSNRDLIELQSLQIPFLPYSFKESGKIVELINSGQLNSNSHLKWIGDKIATAYRTFPNNKSDIELLRAYVPQFLQTNSSNLIFLTFRRPSLTILSTIKMFPEMPLNDVLQHYGEMFDYQIELLSFKGCVPIIWDFHSKTNSLKIYSLLGIDGHQVGVRNYELTSQVTWKQRISNVRALKKLPCQARVRIQQMDIIYESFLSQAKFDSSLGAFKLRMS